MIGNDKDERGGNAYGDGRISMGERIDSKVTTSSKSADEHTITSDVDEELEKTSDVSPRSHLVPELAAAVAASAIPRWSPATREIYLGVLAGILCVYSFGYDISLMTSMVAMPYWHKQFPGVGVSGGFMSGVIAMYNAGIMLGSPFSSMVTDKYGRRQALMFGAVIVLIGTALASSAFSIVQFMFSRFTLGIGAAFMVIPALAYLTEISPPQWRGRIVGSFNAGYYLGSIPCSAICYGTNFIKSHWSWRIPQILQALAAIGLLLIVPFTPESPRFLMKLGKEEETLAWLVKYHGNGDPNSRLVLLEYEEMSTSIRAAETSSPLAYSELFSTRSRRRRMEQVVLMAFFSQFTGNGLSYFSVAIYQNIGIKTPSQQLGYHLMSSGLSSLGALAGALCCDHVRRRYMLVGGSVAMAITLSVVTALMRAFGNKPANDPSGQPLGRAALAHIILFYMIQGYTYMCLNAVVPGEALTTAMRARGLSVKWIVMMAMQFTSIFGIGIGLKRQGWKFILLFVVMNVVAGLFWYARGIEAQGMTIEELDWVYEQRDPVKASRLAREGLRNGRTESRKGLVEAGAV